MISDHATATLMDVHPVIGGRTWRRLFWMGRRLFAQVRRFLSPTTLDPRAARAEILYTSATVGGDALALALALPWG